MIKYYNRLLLEFPINWGFALFSALPHQGLSAINKCSTDEQDRDLIFAALNPTLKDTYEMVYNKIIWLCEAKMFQKLELLISSRIFDICGGT